MDDRERFGPELSDRAREVLEAGEGHFGVCPECGNTGEYRNIYKQHFFFCDEHQITWTPGANLFSSWHHETEEDWRKAWGKLRYYRPVDGFGRYAPGAPLGEQTSFEDLVPPE